MLDKDKPSTDMRSSIEAAARVASVYVNLFPCLRFANLMREWVGLVYQTPDYSPIIGKFDGIKGFYLDIGWGGSGFMTGPAVGEFLSELIATDVTPPALEPFGLSRFYKDKAVAVASC